MAVLSKYFSTLPKTGRDCVTLSKIIDFLDIILSTVVSVDAGAFGDGIILRITQPLLEHLINSIPTTVLLMPSSCNTLGLSAKDIENAKPKPALQISVCRLLTT
jgi:hypothetical protein